MGFWTYGKPHTCNDRCWCNGEPRPKRKGKTKEKAEKPRGGRNHSR